MSKALLYREWKVLKFVLLALILVTLGKTYITFKDLPIIGNEVISAEQIMKKDILQSLDKISKESLEKIKEDSQKAFKTTAYKDGSSYYLILAVLILIMSYSQFKMERTSNMESMSYSLPIEKGTIFINKILAGLGLLFLVFIIDFIVLYINYLNLKLFLSPGIQIIDITRFCIHKMLGFMLLYATFMTIMSFCSNPNFGAFLSTAIFVLSIYIGSTTKTLASSVTFPDTIKSIFRYLSTFIETYLNTFYSYTKFESPDKLWFYHQMLFYIVLIILFTLIGINYFHKYKLEEKNKLIQFKKTKILLLISYAIVPIIAGFEAYFKKRLDFDNEMSFTIMIIPILILLIPYIFITYKWIISCLRKRSVTL